jgi:hypothetical protein
VLEDRLNARFVDAAEAIDQQDFAGFAVLALDCLLIETLQQFKAGGSNPLSSTIFQKGTSSVHRGSNRFVPGRRRFGLSGCYGESLGTKS